MDPAADDTWFEMRMACNDGIYRADAIDGCDPFANRRYCP